MPGLFSKGKEKLKQDLITAKDAKEERIKQESAQNKSNNIAEAGNSNPKVVSISDYAGEKFLISTKIGGKPMSRQLLIDSVCYNIAVNAPIFRRLISAEIIFVKDSIPWHVSCNGKRTLVSEDILGKSINDIIFLFLKEFVHVALGHKIKYSFASEVVMTEERMAMMRIEKNILDNCIVLSGLLSSPGEFGVSESLCDISPGLKSEIASLFNSCEFEIGSTFWKDELSLKFMEDILQGDSRSFDSKRRIYFKDINYKLSTKEKIPSYLRRSNKNKDRSQEIHIVLPRDILKDEIRNKRSEKLDNPNRLEIPNEKSESDAKEAANSEKLANSDGDVQKPQSNSEKLNEQISNPKDDIKKGEKNDNTNSKKNSPSENDDKREEHEKNNEDQISALKNDNPPPEEYYEDELLCPKDYEEDEFFEDELWEPNDESNISPLSDYEKSMGMESCKSDDDNPDESKNTDISSQNGQQNAHKNKKSVKKEIGATEFGGDYDRDSGDGEVEYDIPDGYELLSNEERNCYEQSSDILRRNEGSASFSRDASDIMGEIYGSLSDIELEDLTEQMNALGVDLLESKPCEQLEFMLNKLNQFSDNSVKDMLSDALKNRIHELSAQIPPSKEELAQAHENLKTLQQTMQERQQDNDALQNAMSEWDVPDVQSFENFESGDFGGNKMSPKISEEISEIPPKNNLNTDSELSELNTEQDINFINAREYAAQYKSLGDSEDELGGEISAVESTVVETKPYDFMDKAQYKDYLKETFDYYESFGSADVMSASEYDTLRSEMVAASQGRSHGENGGFANRLEKNEYAELFTMSTAWYEKARKMIMSCKPKMQNSYTRPNKKYLYQGITLQSPSTSGNVCDINQLKVYIDSSGSMSAKDMIIFKSIVKTASKLFPKDVEAFEFNTKVSPLRVVNGMIKEDPKTSGGTAIKCVLGSLISMPQKDIKRTLVIVVSDGEYDWGDVTEFCKNYRTTKFLFMITSGLRGVYRTKYDAFSKEISSKQVQTIFVDSVSENNAVVWR